MKRTLPEVLCAVGTLPTRIDALFQEADPVARRAALIAQLLRSIWPSAPLYACRLMGGGRSQVEVLSESGENHPEWKDKLEKELARPDTPNNRKTKTAARLLQSLKLTGHTLIVSPMAFRDHRYGSLALALSNQAAPEEEAAGRTLLAACCHELVLRLELERQQLERRSLEEDSTAQIELADAGELAGPLAHEFNNFLNSILLHVAVLEADASENLRAALREIRRKGAGITALVKQFQQYRRRQQPLLTPIDINQVVAGALHALSHGQSGPDQEVPIKPVSPERAEGAGQAAGGVPVRLVLAPALPPLLGSASDLKRLITFLLRNATAAAASGEGRVLVRTERAGDKVLLHVEDTGPALPAESLPELFEPGAPGREGTSSLELAACHSLVKRCQGRIEGANRAGGGMVITVALPVQPDKK